MKLFKRVYLKLDKKNKIAKVILETTYKMEGKNPNELWDQLVNTLNKVEGKEAIVKYEEKEINEIWDGLYKTNELELPLLGFMDRMQLKEDVFNFLYYTFDGNSNEDLVNYLYLDGVNYKIKKFNKIRKKLFH